jgi:predicted RNase H-like HicB family nuclease
MTKYELILYWSDEDQSFIAEAPELAGWTGRLVPEPKGRLLFA